MTEVHALITGATISGRIPHGDSWLDVTPDAIYFDTQQEALDAADSIEVEHHVRGTHPIQLACKALSDPTEHPSPHPDVLASHRDDHKSLDARIAILKSGNRAAAPTSDPSAPTEGGK